MVEIVQNKHSVHANLLRFKLNKIGNIKRVIATKLKNLINTISRYHFIIALSFYHHFTIGNIKRVIAVKGFKS